MSAYSKGEYTSDTVTRDFQLMFRSYFQQIDCPNTGHLSTLKSYGSLSLQIYWSFLKLANFEVEFPADQDLNRYVVSRFYEDFHKSSKE